jgi:hypothetical protein
VVNPSITTQQRLGRRLTDRNWSSFYGNFLLWWAPQAMSGCGPGRVPTEKARILMVPALCQRVSPASDVRPVCGGKQVTPACWLLGLQIDSAEHVRSSSGVRRDGCEAMIHRLRPEPDGTSLRGQRDYTTLAILLGCGLRRSELTALRVEDIEQREEHWVVVDLVGKGGHIRTIPAPDWVKDGIDVWMTAAGITTARSFFRSIRLAGFGAMDSARRSFGVS